MKNLFFLLCIVSVTSCNLLRVTPHKDGAMIVAVMDGKTANHELYNKIAASTNKTYTPYAPDYANIHARWDSLIVINTTRKHAKKILKQCQLGMKNTDQLADEHRTKGVLAPKEIKINDLVSAGFWAAPLVSELSLKN